MPGAVAEAEIAGRETGKIYVESNLQLYQAVQVSPQVWVFVRNRSSQWVRNILEKHIQM